GTAHADVRRQAPRGLSGDAPAGEVEARSNLLLDLAVQQPVDARAEQARLVEGRAREVFGESVPDSRTRRQTLGMKTDAGEKIQRPVLAEQIPAPQVDERARRQLELLRSGAALHHTVHDAQPPL